MVMYIRLVTKQQEADAESKRRFRELWIDNGRDGPPPPLRSLPIRIWALLREGLE